MQRLPSDLSRSQLTASSRNTSNQTSYHINLTNPVHSNINLCAVLPGNPFVPPTKINTHKHQHQHVLSLISQTPTSDHSLQPPGISKKTVPQLSPHKHSDREDGGTTHHDRHPARSDFQRHHLRHRSTETLANAKHRRRQQVQPHGAQVPSPPPPSHWEAGAAEVRVPRGVSFDLIRDGME